MTLFLIIGAVCIVGSLIAIFGVKAIKYILITGALLFVGIFGYFFLYALTH